MYRSFLVVSALCAFLALGASGVDTNAVLVSVNGRALTIAEADRGVALRLKFFEQAHKPKNVFAKSADPRKMEDDKARFAQKLHQEAVGAFIRKGVLLAFAKDRHLTLSPTGVVARCESTARQVGFADYADLKKGLTEDEISYFESTLREEMLTEAAERQIRSEINASVGEKEMADAFARLREINATAAATNRLVWARATNVYERVKSNELDFQAAVKRYSEQDPREEDGFFTFNTVPDILKYEPVLGKYMLLNTPKVGDILPPMDGDNGVVICKVAAQEDEKFELHAVYFRLAQNWKVPTAEELRGVLSSNKLNAGYRKKFEELSANCRIEFPNRK